jgi:hypothetical protein
VMHFVGSLMSIVWFYGHVEHVLSGIILGLSDGHVIFMQDVFYVFNLSNA